jgi:hypothetical protein
MPRNRLINGAIGAIALAGALVAGAAQASAACRAPVRSALVTGINQTLTELRARTGWRNKVRTIYGYRFARWGYARNKNMDCNKVRPGRSWACRAIASPCDRRPRSS